MINRSIITIPVGFLRHLDFNWDIDWRSQSPRAKLDGSSEDVLNAYPLWVGGSRVSLRQGDILTWRAIRARAQGRANLYRVRMCDPLSSHKSSPQVQNGIPYSDNQPFSTGLGFEYRPFVTAVSNVARGAEVMTVSGAVPRLGQIISHDDWPYIVTSVTTLSGGDHRVTFQMPLCAPIPAGATVFLDGSGLFEAVDPDMGAAPYGPGFHATTQLAFRQYINR